MERPDPSKDLAPLAEYGLRYTPHVSLDEDCVFFDLTEVGHLVKEELSFVLRLIQDCHRQGFFPVWIAVADTPQAARAIVHFAFPELDVPLSRAWILPPGKSWEWVKSLPVEALQVGDEGHRICHELGCHRLEDVQRVPLSEWYDRLGEEFVVKFQQILGQQEEILPPYQPPPRFEERIWLEHPTTVRDILDAYLFDILRRLEGSLVREGQGALELTVELQCEDNSRLSFHVGFFQPTVSAARFFTLLQLRMEDIRIPAAVVAIRAIVPYVAALEWKQPCLFSEKDILPYFQEWEDLLERLAARLGRERVCQAFLEPDHAPEYVVRWKSCLALRGRQRNIGKYSTAHKSFNPRPLYLFNHPVVMETVTGVPSGVPYCVRYRGQVVVVTRCWGPERIETGWWRGRAIARDYYRVELATGQHLWVYRCLETGRWFLHGVFG